MARRVFLAVDLGDEAALRVRRVIRELKTKFSRAPIRWVREGVIHITLHFLGDQNEEGIQKIILVCERVVPAFRTTEYELDGLGFFPDAQEPRVVWIAAQETNGKVLEALQTRLGRELEKQGIDVDHRPWHPHVTIGRITLRLNRGQAPALRQMRSTATKFIVDTVHLCESHLEQGGPRYEIIQSFPLRRA